LASAQPNAHSALIFDIRGVGWHCWSSSTLKPLFKFTYLWWRHYVQQSKCLAFSCPAISCPAISCSVIWSVIFMSCIFMTCYLVRHFHVLQFHALLYGPSISGPSFSYPSFSAPPLGQSPDYITDLLQPVAATSSRSSLRDASRGDYVVPRTNRKTADRAFSTAAPRAWNQLPTELRRTHPPIAEY